MKFHKHISNEAKTKCTMVIPNGPETSEQLGVGTTVSVILTSQRTAQALRHGTQSVSYERGEAERALQDRTTECKRT
jgi:hypothetical protein